MEKEIQSARVDNAEVKIGIIGLGSIGRKHALSLKEIGFTNIIALRTFKGSKKDLPAELNFINQTDSEKDFFESNLSGVILANPTSMHVEYAKKCLQHDLPVLVEKPISAEFEELEELKNLKTELIKVAFCLRFHPVIQLVKQLLNENKLGRLYQTKLSVGQYLPHWHPYTDYRDEYYSKKELGGGGIRTLSHEIDLMLYFCGVPNQIQSFVNKLSDLEIDVDDYSLILAKYTNSICRVEIDLFARNVTRTGVLFGENGEIRYDVVENKVTFIDNEGKVHNLEVGNTNMYVEQMKDFTQFIINKKSLSSSFSDSYTMMTLINKAEDFSKNSDWKTIKQ